GDSGFAAGRARSFPASPERLLDLRGNRQTPQQPGRHGENADARGRRQTSPGPAREVRLMDCNHCRERIWDQLFGLLEAAESSRLRHHVAECNACQTEMATAVAEHRLVAEAARLEVDIPAFAAP